MTFSAVIQIAHGLFDKRRPWGEDGVSKNGRRVDWKFCFR
jgi:hypothetical protein